MLSKGLQRMISRLKSQQFAIPMGNRGPGGRITSVRRKGDRNSKGKGML